MPEKTREELLRYLRGLQKKHGVDVEVVLKVTTASGKVRRRSGRLLGLRGEAEVGLHSAEKGSGDTWYPLDCVHDCWKRGAGPTEG